MGRWKFVPHCLSKAKYKTPEEADAARILKQVAYGCPLQVYLCRFCRCWHLTSKMK